MDIFYAAALYNNKIACDLLDSINDNDSIEKHENEINVVIFNAIFTLSCCYLRIKDLLNGSDDILFRGIYYLFNQIKHDRDLNFIKYNIYENRYPKKYPYRYGLPKILFADFIDHGRKHSIGKREHYEIYLMNNEVTEVLNKAQIILEKEYKQTNSI